MDAIRQEVMVFILALLAGGMVRLAYRIIECVRHMIRHTRLAVELEDMVYWLGVAVYLFVQIYHTSDGSIRWNFALGVVLGVVLTSVLIMKTKKLHKKIYIWRRKVFSQKT